MKRPARLLPFLFICVFCAALLLFAADARDAVRASLQQCAYVLVPSLFPFCAAANLLVALDYADALGRRYGRLLPRLFGVSAQGAAALLLGFLGGFPIGAQTVAALYLRGSISKSDALRLSAFTNNAGPAFVVGAVGLAVFHSTALGLRLYLVQVCAALLTGLVLRTGACGDADTTQVRTFSPVAARLSFSAAFSRAIAQAAGAMLNICGFVTFFQVLLSLLRKLPLAAYLPQSADALLSGVLELSCGVQRLSGGTPLLSFALASVLLGWGGLCVHAQALCALGEAKLPCGAYLRGKLLQTLFSAALSVPAALLPFGGSVLLLLGLPVIFFLPKKRAGNSARRMV